MKAYPKLIAALGILALVAVPAAVAGMWSNFPTVGVASHCASENLSGVPGTTAVCTNTVPAGPNSVTGNETVPADSNLSQGRPPQQINLSMAAFNALPITVQATVANGVNTVTASATQGGLILTHSGTITSLALTLPPNPKDGQQFALSSNRTITTLTFAGGTGSASVASAPTVLTLSTTAPMGYRFMYNLTANTWYRIQ